jgi:hypothetical protein
MGEVDDLILISVDDHIIEPPDMFTHLPKPSTRTDAPRAGAQRRRLRRVDSSATVIPNGGAERGGGSAQGGVRPRAQGLDEIRPGCYDVHERVKDMNAGGMLASMNFPSFPGFAAGVRHRGPGVLAGPRARLQRLAHRRVVRSYPGRFIPMAVPVIWDPELTRPRFAGCGQGVPLADLHREPGGAGLPELPHDYWDPVWAGLLRHRDRAERPPRFLGPAGPSRRRFAAGRDDHAAADEHPVGRGRPVVVPAIKNYPDLKSRCPRAAPGGSRTSSSGWTGPTRCTGPGRCRTSAASSRVEVFREHFLTCFISDPVGIAAAGPIGIDNIAGRPTTRTRTRCGRTPPRSWPLSSPPTAFPTRHRQNDP